jgi:hypothetical protein
LFKTPAQKLGLLFHAKEFPELCKDYPYVLGYCQRSSSLQAGVTGMDWRNSLWYEERHLSHQHQLHTGERESSMK